MYYRHFPGTVGCTCSFDQGVEREEAHIGGPLLSSIPHKPRRGQFTLIIIIGVILASHSMQAPEFHTLAVQRKGEFQIPASFVKVGV